MGEEELSTAWDKTKKDARRQAAELAVRGLVANGGFGKFSSLATSVSYCFIISFINTSVTFDFQVQYRAVTCYVSFPDLFNKCSKTKEFFIYE